MNKKITVMGVGNTLLKDEGIGVKVVEEIRASYQFDKDINLVDGGVGGYSLIYRIKDSDFLILIDAVDVGKEPGSIVSYKLKKFHAAGGREIFSDLPQHFSAHQIGILDIIQISQTLYGYPDMVNIIGVQPIDMSLGSDMEVSHEMKNIIPGVVSEVLKELRCLEVESLELKV